MFMPRGVWYGSLLLAFSVVDVRGPWLSMTRERHRYPVWEEYCFYLQSIVSHPGEPKVLSFQLVICFLF